MSPTPLDPDLGGILQGMSDRITRLENTLLLPKTAVTLYDQQINANSFTFTGLDGNVDSIYEFEWDFSPSPTQTYVWARFNGDTGNNYAYQQWIGYNTTVSANSAGSQNAIQVATYYNTGAINYSRGTAKIYCRPGSNSFRALQSSWFCYDNVGGFMLGRNGGLWNNTTDKITSFTIFGGSGINLVGRVILRRVS